MKQSTTTTKELCKLILKELQLIVGENSVTNSRENELSWNIRPSNYDHCLWQTTIKSLMEYLEKYQLEYYIDFNLGYFHVYTTERLQLELRNL